MNPSQPSRRLPLAGRPSLGNSHAARDREQNFSMPITAAQPPDPSPQPPRDFSASYRDNARVASYETLTSGQSTPRLSHQTGDSRRVTMDSPQDISIDIGDAVSVPGGMTGTVKFLGIVKGKKGVFAGVELSREFAQRGKNDGDVDG